MSSEYRHFLSRTRLNHDKEVNAMKAVANLSGWDEAVSEIMTWPGYVPQPLHSLNNQAAKLGISKLYYKDESQRFGRELGSFKALGAPYAVYMLLADAVCSVTGRRPDAAALRAGEFRHITRKITVCVATDGNQGRGLAYAAATFGCRCVIYIHSHVSTGRKLAMENYGATVIRVNGEYEASVSRAKEDARINDWHFVSSTSWEDFSEPLPRYVMNAYMVMVEEALDALPDPDAITHVFMQGGVGSIAAAVFMGLRAARSKHDLPRFVVVEPLEADCLFQSAFHGHPTPSSGSLHTIMAGLACREVSPAAWKILEWLGSDYIAISDEWVSEAMAVLAGSGIDIPIVSGESAAGGFGVLLKSARDKELSQKLGLNENSQVLLFGCEGATDPEIYQQITGHSAEDVFSRQTMLRATQKNSQEGSACQ